MNPEEIDGVAAQFNAKAGELDRVKGELESQVNSTSGNWKGSDAETFRNNWPTFRTQLINIANALRDVERALRAQAEQQRETSGA
jgi:WXG100 family type VII secretion target